MSTLCWNCCGLGNSQTVQVLVDLVHENKPEFVILLETLCNQARIQYVKRLIQFEGMFVVNAVGHSGGIAFL